MAVQTLIGSLKQVELFQGLSPLQITEIARQAERVTFRPGDVIVSDGAVGDAAYLIVGGDALRIDGPSLDGPDPVTPGSVVGEMAMLVETEHSSTVVAHGPVKALRIPRSIMIALMTTDPSIADHLVHKISGRLNSVLAQYKAIEATLTGGDDQPPAHASDGSANPTTAAVARH